MKNYYLLWATGEDRPGIVAALTQALYISRCNLEDSSMMRLGSEFGILLIFTSKRALNENHFEKITSKLRRDLALHLGFQKISKGQARFKPVKRTPALITIHGFDSPGLVFKVTSLLSKSKFNITDLSTHRTTQGKRAGYILIIEGELPKRVNLSSLERKLHSIEKPLGVKISAQLINSAASF